MKIDDLIEYLESSKASKGGDYVLVNGNWFEFSGREIQSPFDGEYYVTLENPESMDIELSKCQEGKHYVIIPCKIFGVHFRKGYDRGQLLCFVDLQPIDKSIIPDWYDLEEYHDDFEVNFIALNHHPMTPLEKQDMGFYEFND
jgi:hypothetical protein